MFFPFLIFMPLASANLTELTFELADKEIQCFYEELQKDVKCNLIFQSLLLDIVQLQKAGCGTYQLLDRLTMLNINFKTRTLHYQRQKVKENLTF
eukprot:g28546.t1